MNGEEINVWGEDPKQECLPRAQWLVAAALLALAVCCVAITNQSYWIDEATAGLMAKEPTFARGWRIVSENGADLQMPLYFLFVWGWERLAGSSEFAMRAGNILWFLPGLIAVSCALAGKRLLRWTFMIVLLGSPFVWYYLNEARPYAMQLGMSLVVFAALCRLGSTQKGSTEERGWVITLGVGSVLLGATTLLAMLWLGAYLGAAIVSAPRDRRWRLVGDYRLYWGTMLTGLLAVGLFYCWTLTRGARGIWGVTDIRNVAFVAYELLGFSGLGPGRVAIRNGGLQVFWPWLPWLTIYGVVLLIVLTQGWKQIVGSTSRHTRISWIVALAMVAGFILAAGAELRWRVVGRHCVSMLVPILFVLGAGMAALLRRGTRAGQAVVVAFVGLNLVSDLNLRFSERHAKDDFRTAATIAAAAAARGERVWWCADGGAGVYYGVPLSQGDSALLPGRVWLVMNPVEHLLDHQPPPQLVVLFSKSDGADKQNRIRAYLDQGNYKVSQVLTSFTIWQK